MAPDDNHNGISNRELFQKLMDVVEKNHEAQKATVEALKKIEEQLGTIRSLLESRMWVLLIVLVTALLAAVGIKLAWPTV